MTTLQQLNMLLMITFKMNNVALEVDNDDFVKGEMLVIITFEINNIAFYLADYDFVKG